MLGDAIRDALPTLRSEAESSMTSTALVSRSSGAPVFDPVTGLITSTDDDVLTSPARLRQPASLVESSVLFGEEDVTKQRFIVDFPYTVTGVRLGDVVTFPEEDDPEATGRAFRVIGLSIRDHMVTRSVGVELVE